MFVVVPFVSRVTVAVVDIVDVVAMRDGDMAAFSAVFVGVVGMCDVFVRLAFVDVAFVGAVQVAVVQVVHVVAMRDGDVAAAIAVLVGVISVFGVGSHGRLRWGFAGVVDGVGDDVGHVLIGERIDTFSAVRLNVDEPVGSQHPKVL
jgi:hypothetical protein